MAVKAAVKIYINIHQTTIFHHQVQTALLISYHFGNMGKGRTNRLVPTAHLFLERKVKESVAFHCPQY